MQIRIWVMSLAAIGLYWLISYEGGRGARGLLLLAVALCGLAACLYALKTGRPGAWIIRRSTLPPPAVVRAYAAVGVIPAAAAAVFAVLPAPGYGALGELPSGSGVPLAAIAALAVGALAAYVLLRMRRRPEPPPG